MPESGREAFLSNEHLSQIKEAVNTAGDTQPHHCDILSGLSPGQQLSSGQAEQAHLTRPDTPKELFRGDAGDCGCAMWSMGYCCQC